MNCSPGARLQCGNRGIATIPLRDPLPVPAQPRAWRPPLRHSSGARPSPGSPRHPRNPGLQQTASFERTGHCHPETRYSARCFLCCLERHVGPVHAFPDIPIMPSCPHACETADQACSIFFDHERQFLEHRCGWHPRSASRAASIPSVRNRFGCGVAGADRSLRCRAPGSGLVSQRSPLPGVPRFEASRATGIHRGSLAGARLAAARLRIEPMATAPVQTLQSHSPCRPCFLRACPSLLRRASAPTTLALPGRCPAVRTGAERQAPSGCAGNRRAARSTRGPRSPVSTAD